MKRAIVKITDAVRRFATVLTTLVVGFVFALVSSAVAAPVEKHFMFNKPDVVEKFMKPEMKEDSSSKAFFDRRPFFNRNFFIDRDRDFDRRPFFFNPFFDFDDFDRDDDDRDR